jgi:metal-responsive CopG/Arc/MetJ family transcriptional regulator
MRTTVEIRDDQRSALAALASKRGLRGFSKLVQEAVDNYLQDQRRDRVDEALALEGVLSDEEAHELRQRIDEAWATWQPAS